MIEINLVPDVKQELLKAQTVRSAVVSISIVVGVIAAGLVVLVAIYVYGAQALLNRAADDTTKKRNEQLQSVSDLSKTITIQNQLSAIESTNGERQINSRLRDVIQATAPGAPNEPRISKLTKSSETSTVEIEAQAINSYQAAEIFKKSIDGVELQFSGEGDDIQTVKLASDVRVVETSYGEDSTSGGTILTFKIVFTYATELFDPNLKNFKIVQTTTGNVTDSYLGVPRSLFADKIPVREEN